MAKVKWDKNFPALRYYSITDSDSVDETYPFMWLNVGVGGVVPIVGMDGNAVNLTLAQGWYYLPGKRVNSTGLTASSLVGAYHL